MEKFTLLCNLTQHVIISNQHECDRSSIKNHLSIDNCSFDEQAHLFLDNFKPIIIVVQFTRLNPADSYGMLIRMMQLSPGIDYSLKVTSLPVIQSDWFFNKKNTKVNLEKMRQVEQMHFLLYLCFFPISSSGLSKKTDLKIFVRFVLTKSNIYIYICLIYISNADPKTVNTEKLLVNYTIKRICITILSKSK